MARPIRVEYTNAVYHVTAQGNERKANYRDDADRQRFLETIEETVERFGLAIESLVEQEADGRVAIWLRVRVGG